MSDQERSDPLSPPETTGSDATSEDATSQSVTPSAEISAESSSKGTDKAPEKPKRSSPPPGVSNPKSSKPNPEKVPEKAEDERLGAIPKRPPGVPEDLPIEVDPLVLEMSRVSPIGMPKHKHVETGVFSPRPTRPTQLHGIEPAVSPREAERAFSPQSADLRQLCVDFLDYKKSRLNEQKAMENEMELMFPKMQQLLRGLEKMSLRVGKIPTTTPTDEVDLRNENDRLNYIIVTSASLFGQIDELLEPLRSKVRQFTRMTAESNNGIDDRLKKIIKAICAKADPEEKGKPKPKSPDDTSPDAKAKSKSPVSTIGSVVTDFFARHHIGPTGKIVDEIQETIDKHSLILEGPSQPRDIGRPSDLGERGTVEAKSSEKVMPVGQTDKSVIPEGPKEVDSQSGEAHRKGGSMGLMVQSSTEEPKGATAERSVESTSDKGAAVERPVGTAGDKGAAVERPVGTAGDKGAADERPVGTAGDKGAAAERPVVTAGDKGAAAERPVETAGDKGAAAERPVGSAGDKGTAAERPVGSTGEKGAPTERPVKDADRKEK